MSYSKESIQGVTERIGMGFKGRRVQAGISQKELSERSGVSPASIARFETGKGNLSLQNLLMLMRSLGIIEELEQIFREPEDSPFLLAKATSRKTKERVRKSRKIDAISNKDWKWGDEP